MNDPVRILLVEDNPGDARLTAELLREADVLKFELVHASTFAECLQHLGAGEFSVVLLDLSLPDAHGIESASHLNARHSQVPLIVLTGLDDAKIALSALQAGAQDYLVKGQGDGHLISRAIRYAIERKRGEVLLIEAKNSAEAASRAKSEFLANMSHELRTPLNAIIGFSEILKQEALGPLGHDSYRNYVGDIHDSGIHLLRIINDILDLSKVEVGKLTINEAPFDPREVVESCLRIVRERATDNGVDLIAEFASNLPTLNADERMVKQILLNLLSNAVKFTNRGGSVSISVACGADDGVVMRVVDTGIGIAPEDIERAMQPFVQIDSSLQRKFSGTGLGLPLARSMVELHGGIFAIESAVGKGTAITVSFPPARSLRSASEAASDAA